MAAKRRICVIGLGQFGRHLARALSRDCEVLAIDRNHALVNEMAEIAQRAVALDARDRLALAEVVSDDFDAAVVAIGGNLEASILAVLHLKQLGIGKIYAKAMNRDHAQILGSVGAHEIVFPERESAQRLSAQFVNPNLVDFIPLAEGYLVMQVVAPEAFFDRTLAQLDLRRRFGINVIAIKEHVPERMSFLPGPDFRVKPSDTLVVIGRRESLERIHAAKPPEAESAP